MEKKALRDALIKLGICVVFAILYCLGGMEGMTKALRRFAAPGVLCAGMIYFSRDWRSLIQLPFMFLSLSLGYGVDSTIMKILRRGLFGFTNGISTSGYNLLQKKWLLVGIQVILLTGLYIAVGVYNPLGNARTEELFFGIIIPIIPLFSAQRKDA